MAKRKNRSDKQNALLWLWIFAALCMGIFIGYEYKDQINPQISNSAEKQYVLPENIKLCFTPANKCTPLIIKSIAAAK